MPRYIDGPVISAVGSWNGNIAIEGTIRVLIEHVSVGLIVRIADR